MSADVPGRLVALKPRVARILAPNPSPFTHTGTWTHLVGEASLAVLDPGPDLPEHIAALTEAIAGRRVEAIVITHNHRDHSPAAAALAKVSGAPIVGAAPIALVDGGPRADDGFDLDYSPDRVLADGEALTGDGWALTAIATPGHTSNHLSFALADSGIVFPGDHVMGWSTTVVSPPDGDMTDYMASLEKLLAREDDRIYYPAHGDPVENPRRLVRGLLGHRKQREGQILRLLAADVTTIPDMVAKMYVGIDPRLFPAAERSVLAHLIDLRGRGLVEGGEGAWRSS
ncbi:MAG: MBL fold metallo-hydrolase [Pseudomonadota bacterium]